VLASRRRTPQNFSFVRIKLKSVRLHPTGYGTGAGSELGGKCIDVRGRARAIDLCVVGIQRHDAGNYFVPLSVRPIIIFLFQKLRQIT